MKKTITLLCGALALWCLVSLFIPIIAPHYPASEYHPGSGDYTKELDPELHASLRILTKRAKEADVENFLRMAQGFHGAWRQTECGCSASIERISQPKRV